ncbi:nitric oxide reductase activation protein NorD [Pseudoduganella violacea]|uniref:Nitric oxide reductase NorD protein n=1 Tax=Pseudoduganella violacea TaxID=1715466 RepID=A0A7W5BCZ5_9BURK|nr:VWA domain-containing protein [Pseudoduganella violacea]MBB3120942.1 nitric oxide reductase NorD protein [Pseudoduganella violacea]
MAEAEDVITDAAMHAASYMQAHWRRHRAKTGAPLLALADVSRRLELLCHSLFGAAFVFRPAQVPLPATVLSRLFQRPQLPSRSAALPATDGCHIWLPPALPAGDEQAALAQYRAMALQQAMRAARGSAASLPTGASPLLLALYQLLEADAADRALAQLAPGMQQPLNAWRAQALSTRPQLSAFAPPARAIEQILRDTLARPLEQAAQAPTAPEVLRLAEALAGRLTAQSNGLRAPALWLDAWSGELRRPAVLLSAAGSQADGQAPGKSRSARLPRRPTARQASDGEDDTSGQGPSMVQTAQPQEKAEDPMGLQRPLDRDADSAAEDYADALSELAEARLIVAPGHPKEYLLADDLPERAPRTALPPSAAHGAGGTTTLYPEWDYGSQSYRERYAAVHTVTAESGPESWVAQTLRSYGGMLAEVRRRFDMLRAQRLRVQRQPEGDEIDLQAWMDSRADRMAGLSPEQRLYQREIRARRDMAIMLLADVSGSTDSWLGSSRRVIDIEREALLLVCIALQGMRERFAVQAFSGEGPQGVTMRAVKGFGESYTPAIARRIAGLEPERYTRAGAALRHAAAQLMAQGAQHRLLILLSDGKPNDCDQYEGRYGIEDMRQAVNECRLQGISPFCLTIDRQAAGYLPQIFGPHGYCLLPEPDLLPAALLQWLRRLTAS